MFSFIEREERSRDMRGTGVDRGVLLLEIEGHGELPGRGETGDHGVFVAGPGDDVYAGTEDHSVDEQPGDHGDAGEALVLDTAVYGTDGGLVSGLKVGDHGAAVEAVLGEGVASEF